MQPQAFSSAKNSDYSYVPAALKKTLHLIQRVYFYVFHMFLTKNTEIISLHHTEW
jgi:hypothetical protein